MQTADHLRQGIRRVEDGAAIGARMQIRRRSGCMDLEVRQTTEREEERWQAGCEHRRIGDDDGVGRQPRPVLLDEWDEIGRTHLFFAFGQYDDVDRQATPRLQVGLERLDV